MMLLNNDHGHPLPDAPVFYSVLSKNKQELRAAARANRMMKRFHLTIPYIIACLMAYYVFSLLSAVKNQFFRYMYPVLCRGVFYPLVFGTTIYPVPFAASALLPRRIGYVSLFTLYGLEDEDGKLTQARDLAVLSWIQRCKKQIPDNSPVLRIIQNRTFKDPEEEKYIPISLYELILRQLAFQNPDILNGLKYYNRQCDK
ncbi:hypothetical protein DW993_09315 [Clostridium sp. AM51-4]|nr:hypothetical protein [Clostridium sp. AM51-4]RHQ05664.1 hypothetical protein DW993_09315 [Clostridium sp. AM51-4]